MTGRDDLLRTLLAERLRPIPPRPPWPDDIVHPSDMLLATSRRRVLVDAMAGFRVRPYRTYRQLTPQELAERRAA